MALLPVKQEGPIEQEGKRVIEEYCPGYDTSSSSYILPPVFNSTYTEERDTISNEIVAPPKISPSKSRKLQGLSRSQSGEISEYSVFTLFHELQQITLKEQLLFIRNFDLDNKNPHQIKETQIKKELPDIDLTKVSMSKELDGIIIVKQVGIVVLEVKNSANEDAIVKATMQLDNGKHLVEALMGGIQGKTTGIIPCAKVIFVPGEEQKPSPFGLTINNCFQIHQDRLKDFQKVWNDIIRSLQGSPSSFSFAEFKRLTRICVGIWCITPKKRGFTFERHEASLGHQVSKIDRKVLQQVLSSECENVKSEAKKCNPASNVVYCKKETLFRSVSEIGVVYTTPEQKEIFDHHPRTIIRAGAGSGKTFLTLYKVIDIVNDDVDAQVLMIVPPPHDQRCKTILEKNEIDSNIIQKFPAQSGDIKPGVFIISLKNFFQVTRTELLEYNTNNFHIFLDDVQSYRPPRQEHSIAMYSDILDFLDDTYRSATQQDKYLWCCVDVLQSSCHYKDDDSSANLFYDKNGQLRPRAIPMVNLTKVIRNSQEVMTVMSDVHRKNKEVRIKGNWVNAQMSFGEMKAGHSITSAPVQYQKLIQGSPVHCQIPFVVRMLEDEFELLFGSGTSLKPSDVAILYEKLDGDSLQKATEIFLKQKHNFKTQSIEQSITSNNNDAVVFDSYSNAMSYEVACVIFVCQVSLTVPYYGPFVVASRARARLTFIDYDVTKPEFGFVTDNVCLVNWRFNQGAFEKC